ncbi:uncharacterized protein LOC134295872 [Anolis carolinensis]|uniref:uncharacterized protein LOC134295872 n=1 Tax=Anolis carolinensis TaxID=28377 RepID=UPI002F2B7220
MILGGRSYMLLLGTAVFLQNVLSDEKPAWAMIGFDLSAMAQETEQYLKRETSDGLYGSVCQIFRSIFFLEITKRSLQMLYVSSAVLLITVIGLSILCILLKHMKNVKLSQAMTETPAPAEVKYELTQNNKEILEQLVKNTYMINKYMKYAIRLKKKEQKSKLRAIRKIYKTESEASLPMCYCSDSGQESE